MQVCVYVCMYVWRRVCASFDQMRPSFDQMRPSFDQMRPSFDQMRPSFDQMRALTAHKRDSEVGYVE